MKIAILHSGDLANVSPGGISQYIEKVIKYSDNNTITVFGTIEEGSIMKIGQAYELELCNKKYSFIPVNTNKRSPISIFYFINIFKYFKLLKNYDVIYAQRMEYAIPFVFSSLKKKVVFGIHGSGKYSYLYWGNFIGTIYNWVESLAIKTSQKVIVLLKREEFGLPYYQKKFISSKDKFFYGKVPIDTEIFRKVDKEQARKKYGFFDNDNVILYFGRIDNNPKRVLLIPEIIDKLNKKLPNVKCIIIGDGSDRDKLLNKISVLNLKDNIHVHGKIEHGDKLVELINCSDISLILSTFEGICMSALESLVCGVPVLSTDVGDINEYINNNSNGILIKNISDNEVVKNVVDELEKFFINKNIHINDKYVEYEGERVIKELNDIFGEIHGK